MLLVGLIAGATLTWVFKPEHEAKARANQKQPPKKQIAISRKFINPQTESLRHRNYDPRELKGVKEKAEALIARQKATVISIYFRDLTNDQWFGINETEIFTPASLLKVPVMIAILKFEDKHPGTLNQNIPYQKPVQHNYKKPVNAHSALVVGNKYSVEQLLHIMITESDNEATILLMKFLDKEMPGFRKKVEKDLGFQTPEDASAQQDFVTVRRYSAFFRTLYNASYLSGKMSEKALSILSDTGFGYGIRQAIPAEIVVSHKYGYRQVSQDKHQYHHFGIVYHSKKPFLIGIMTKGKNPDTLKEIISLLSAKVYEQVNTQVLDPNGYLQRDLD